MSKLDLILPDSPEAAMSRRNIVAAIGGTALAMTILGGCGGSDDNNNNNNNGGGGGTGGLNATDKAVFNFALNLEYLEAEFYTYATEGVGINTKGVGITGPGTAGDTTGGVTTNFTTPGYRDIALEIAQDERNHVAFIRSALGSEAIAKPAINLQALGSFATEANYIAIARAFEDTGVSAYSGAAPLLSSAALVAAAGILGTEALHTGSIRYQAIVSGYTSPKLDTKDQPPTSGDNFGTDPNSLAIARSTQEVLRIVFATAPGATGVTSGGFFPNGVNGSIRTT